MKLLPTREQLSDIRVLAVFCAAVSGLLVAFMFLPPDSMIEAVVVGVVVLGVGLLVAARALRPWQGSRQGGIAVVLVSAGILVGVAVVTVSIG